MSEIREKLGKFVCIDVRKMNSVASSHSDAYPHASLGVDEYMSHHNMLCL